jgi:hypothetical protein
LLRQLDAGLSRHRPGFDSLPIRGGRSETGVAGPSIPPVCATPSNSSVVSNLDTAKNHEMNDKHSETPQFLLNIPQNIEKFFFPETGNTELHTQPSAFFFLFSVFKDPDSSRCEKLF